MFNYSYLIVILLATGVLYPYFMLSSAMEAVLMSVDRRGSKQPIASYICSMHPQVVSNENGKCPICGQPLEKQNSRADSTKTKS